MDNLDSENRLVQQKEAVEKEPAREDPRLLLASLAHELAHGMFALTENANAAMNLVERSLERQTQITPEDGHRLIRLLRAVRFESSSQVFEAQKVLATLNPENALGFGRAAVIEVSPIEVLQAMLPDYAYRARQRGIHLEYNETHESIPQIRLELTAMRRVFHNILANAIKYSYHSTPIAAPRSIRIWHRRHDAEGKFWIIRVQNFGIGFEKDELPYIFRPGYRGRQARAEGIFGLGLGLHDVQACMTYHGGRVTIESNPLQGGAYLTTVGLIFPRETGISRRR